MKKLREDEIGMLLAFKVLLFDSPEKRSGGFLEI
jgi:hypothetical protein